MLGLQRSGDRDAEWASAGVADDEDLRDGRQEWDDRMQTLEQIKAMEKAKREAAMKRERAMAYAFSSQQVHIFWFSSHERTQIAEAE